MSNIYRLKFQCKVNTLHLHHKHQSADAVYAKNYCFLFKKIRNINMVCVCVRGCACARPYACVGTRMHAWVCMWVSESIMHVMQIFCYIENYVQLPQELTGLNGTINTINFCTIIILDKLN